MAEERKHIINIHTATGVSEPSGASLYLGEIAVQHTPENPALWIKVGTSEESDVYEKFIGKTEIMNIMNASNILGSGYTYSGLPYVNSATTIADAYSALTNELIKDEYTISAAFNDVNDRLTALSGAMQDIDLEPLSASVVTNKTDIATLSGIVADDEVVTSAALNDLNARIIEVSAATADIPDVSGLETRLTNVETRVSGLSGENLFIEGYEVASGSSEQELALNSGDTISGAFGKIQKQMLDNEETIAASLNDLNSRINTLSGETTDLSEVYEAISGVSGSVSVLSAIMIDNEEIVAASLNDLNDRLLDASSDIETLSGMVGDINLAPLSASVVTNQENITTLSGIIEDNEYVIASALNNLNDRIIAVSGDVASVVGEVSGVLTINLNGEEKGKYSPSGDTTINLSALTEVTGADVLLTGYEISSGTTEEELVIRATDTVNEAFGKLQKQNYDNEEVVSSALNDLDGRVIEMSGVVESNRTAVQNIAVTAVTVSGEGNALTNATYASSALTLTKGNVLTGAKLNNEVKPITNGVVDLGNAVTEMILGSAYTYSGLSYVNSATTIADAYSALTKELFDDEKVTSAALNNLNSRIVELSANTGQGETDPVYSASIAATITQEDIDKWNAAAGGGSTDPNAITGITMNGNAVSVSSRVAALGTVVTAQTQLTKGTATGTGNVVTDINVDNHQITLVKSYSAAPADQFVTLSGAAHNKITALSAATTGINATLTAHTNNEDIHVTAANKTTWNGKQDAISDLAAIRSNAASGMAAYNNVNALSAGTIDELSKKSNTGHTHTISEVNGLQSALDGKSGTGHTHNDYATTGTVNTLNNTVTAHTANTSIHVTTAQTAAWDGKQDAINDLETIRSNAEAGAAKVSNVQSDWNATTGLAVILNKPTIPSAPGTLTTTATTAQSTATNEALTGNISLHKVSKTGSYNDLTNKPTIPTVPAWATASTKPTYTANEVGALPTGTTLDGIADGTTRKLSNYATTGTVNTHTGTTIPNRTSGQMHLPTVSATDNGKILRVVNGAWALVDPATIYSGSGTPAQSLGNDGDIYIQTS